MKRIKIVGFFILMVSIILIFLTNFISRQDQDFARRLALMGTQKSHLQEIAKSVFYTHRYKKQYPKSIDTHRYEFLKNTELNGDKVPRIEKLSYEFFKLLNEFKYVYIGNVPYSILILDKSVNEIYKKNMELVVAFNKQTKAMKSHYEIQMQQYRILQYALFALLILLLIYIFSQIDAIIRFIQKFTRTSDRLIEKSSIEGLQPITVHSHNNDLDAASYNFNTLVAHIDHSLKIATTSTENSIQALEIVERNIALLISLVDSMQEKEREDIYKREDAIIDALEVLTALTRHLKDLKRELEHLLP